MVDHKVLLHKLKLYQCCESTLSWFKSYLCDRTQRVCIQGYLLESKKMVCGVPQESILGPLLFTVFINDLPLAMEHLLVSMYADDSTISINGKTIPLIEEKLNSDLEHVSNCCDENRMVINIDKTKAMLIMTREKLQTLERLILICSYKGIVYLLSHHHHHHLRLMSLLHASMIWTGFLDSSFPSTAVLS